MSKDLDLDLDDILGEAIETVAGEPKSQNDNDKNTQNDTDVDADIESTLGLDELSEELNKGAAKVNDEDGDDELDVLADLGLGDDLESASTDNSEGDVTSSDEDTDKQIPVGDGELDLDADLGIELDAPEEVAVSDPNASSEDNTDSDELDFLDGDDGLVDDEEIDVDGLLGQAKGEAESEEDINFDPLADDLPLSVEENESEKDDDFDPLGDFEASGDSDVAESEAEQDVIEPDFSDDTDLDEFEATDEEVAVIEPDIIDDFMNDNDAVEDDELSDELQDEDDTEDGMIDISADEDLRDTEKAKTSFKPHTEVEDVEEMLGGGVGGMFKNEAADEKPPRELPEVPVSEEPVKTETASDEQSDKPSNESTKAGKQKAKKEKLLSESKGGFGIKSIIVTAVASVILSLGAGAGLMYAYGDKIMGNTSYVNDAVLDSRMDAFAATFEARLAEELKTQADKGDVADQLDEITLSVEGVTDRYNSEFAKLDAQLQVLLSKQTIDKSELEELNRKSLVLLTQFVDDTNAAQSKLSEEVYAKVVKVVREEFSGKDDTVKLDAVLTQMNKMQNSLTETKNRMQTQMNLIGVLESEGDFLSKRMATLEVGGKGSSAEQSSGSKPLRTGYTDDKGEQWGYISVKTKDGTASGGHFKIDNTSKAKTMPYILKGVFLAGTQANPEFKVYVTPRASENATPMGYKVGQQIPGMGKILKVEPTSGNEKVPYVVYTDLGILRGDQ